MIDVKQQEKNSKTVVVLYKKIINKTKLININPIKEIKIFFDLNICLKSLFGFLKSLGLQYCS